MATPHENIQRFEKLAQLHKCIDFPHPDQTNYDECIFVSGWIYAETREPSACRVRAWLDGIPIGETRILFARAEVSDFLSVRRDVPTGFRLLARTLKASDAPRVANILVTVSWKGDPAEYQVGKVSVRLIPAFLHIRPYGEVIHPENATVLHRENIYGSGPPIEEPGAEVMNLLRQYLPAKSSVVDVGCGAGAYGPGLMAEGHEWIGLEANPYCCEILERRQLPFRRVDPKISELPGADGEWDNAICIEVLEHVKEPDIFLREIARLIRTRALFSVPNLEVIPYLYDWRVVPWHLLEADHKNFFTRTSLRNLLSRFFRHVEIFPYGEHPLRTREDVAVHVHLFAVADK